MFYMYSVCVIIYANKDDDDDDYYSWANRSVWYTARCYNTLEVDSPWVTTIYCHHILHGRIWVAKYKVDCCAGMATIQKRSENNPTTVLIGVYMFGCLFTLPN